MTPRIPETNKKPGVCYAVTDDGIELPVIDITHPAFASRASEEEISALIDEAVRSLEAAAKIPPAGRRAALEGSLLGRGWLQAANSFLGGMQTYLNRLGPANLGEAWATGLDRRIAGGLIALSFRLRLQDLAGLLAERLVPALAARPGHPLRLLNIGGGAAADSLNALILLHKQHPCALPGREVTVHVLDLDSEGSNFACRALAALTAPGAPLEGIAARLHHLQYDWTHPSALRTLLDTLEPDAVAAGSTEGALFDYGSDEDIVANFEVLREHAPADFMMLGSVVRDTHTLDPRLARTANTKDMPLIRYIGLDAFRSLAHRARWAVDRVVENPFHFAVSLRKA